MQIGEFARICKTKISVLRHYDKEGLLEPDYVDPFTGYRYYAREQIPVFMRITVLKKAGFSLTEIKQILSDPNNEGQILALIQKKKSELAQAVLYLEEVQKIMLGEKILMKILYIEKDDGLYAKSCIAFDANEQNEKKKAMDAVLQSDGYQRISSYKIMGEAASNDVRLLCEVVKLSDSAVNPDDDTNIAFEDDPSVVGKWKVVGEYAVKDDFNGNVCKSDFPAKDVYFLPGGRRYWCYGWTRGKLICTFGDSSSVNSYTVEEYDGSRYMFVNFKSYEYHHGGKPTVLVLRQADHNSYSADDLARKDNIDLPFEEDLSVLGSWVARDCCRHIEAFDPETIRNRKLFFRRIEFKPDGEVTSLYGDRLISGEDMQVWTKGYVLRKWNRTACAYQIRKINGKEYLFIEWKSGDYIYGNMESNYYVFERE
ncbi:MAG: MerR family transcriptional regulator [Eubacteriales bacterium]